MLKIVGLMKKLKYLESTKHNLLAIICKKKKKKMRYLGHAIRYKKYDIMKNIIQGTVQRKRKRGRLRINYMNNLNMWTEMTNIEIYRACEDRNQWRRLI